MATVIEDIVNSMETEVATELGASYKELAYKIDVQKNNFRQSKLRYGVRALESSEIAGVVKFTTYDQSFEVILTTQYQQSSINDEAQIQAGLDLRASMLDIYKRLINTNAGLPGTVMNVKELVMAEVEYLESDKVAVSKALVTITYRLTLQ